jgi:hypothetical protein
MKCLDITDHINHYAFMITAKYHISASGDGAISNFAAG